MACYLEGESHRVAWVGDREISNRSLRKDSMMDEGQPKEAAKVAAKQRFDDLLELEEILLSGESLEDVLFQGLVTAFEVGFVAGHMASSQVVSYVLNSPPELFEEMVEMLRSLQWVDGRTLEDGYVESYVCPDCGVDSEDGHDSDCEFGRLLKKLASLEMSL